MRTVSLMLVDAEGRGLGTLPPFEVERPHWPETTDIVAGARDLYGIDITVLRILTTTPGVRPGGDVSYLAEAEPTAARRVTALLPSASCTVDEIPHPRRAPYAHPGGPRASLDWAEQSLRDLHHAPVTGAVQRRTWNLSSIWQLDTRDGPVWLKQVPPMFAHEPAVLRWLADVHQPSVPVLLANDDGRMLLRHIPGEDRYTASAEERARIAADFHRLQAASVGHSEQLLALGVPDRRTPRLIDAVTGVARRYGADNAELMGLVDDLPQRFAAIDSCAMPAVLVHGDLHPGNTRSDGGAPVIIDWGDTFVGHPAFDIMRLTETLDPATAQPIVDGWDARWRAQAPDSQPRRALRLLRPVAGLLAAYIYARFLDEIEPSEYPYHAEDVPAGLDRAAADAAAFPV